MIDTIKLTLDKTMFAVLDNNRFEKDLMNSTRGYFLLVQNPTVTELKQGIYKPRLTITNRFNCSGRSEKTLAIEFSIPKFLFGNNFDELTDNDFSNVIQKLKAILKEMGVYVFEKNLINAPVSSIHYSKNISLIDFTTPTTYLDQLRKTNINNMLDITEIEYRNYGHLLKFHANSFEIVFYDKIKDLMRAKLSEKRAEEKDNALQMGLFDILTKRRPFEVLRIEIRLNKRQKIRQIFKDIGKNFEPTFINIFNQDIAKKVLIHYIDEIEEAYPSLLSYQYDSPKKFFSGFLRTNPKIKLTYALKMLGLRILLDEVGVREFREITKYYGNSAWYSLNKEMKAITQTDEPSVFSLLREQINKFNALKLLAIQDKMLNNVKYN